MGEGSGLIRTMGTAGSGKAGFVVTASEKAVVSIGGVGVAYRAIFSGI
jgi:hypothetical protein